MSVTYLCNNLTKRSYIIVEKYRDVIHSPAFVYIRLISYDACVRNLWTNVRGYLYKLHNMRIVFNLKEEGDHVAFKDAPTYDAVNRGVGMSGTHTSVAELSHFLASKHHDVFVICRHDLECDDTVKYVSNASKIPHGQIDVYCSLLPFYLPEQMEGLNILRDRINHYVIWLHCLIYPQVWNSLTQYMKQHRFAPKRLSLVGPTKYSKRCLSFDLMNNFYVVPNGLNPSVFENVSVNNTEERFGRWSFHAAWERGGPVSERVFSKYADKYCPNSGELLVFDLTCNAISNSKYTQTIPRVNKTKLAEYLGKCDYFVYPLVLADGRVHHDTFACCVLEAMAAGVIVVGWKCACLPELYSKHAILLDPPEYDSGDSRSPFGTSFEMLSENCVDKLLAAIENLDNDVTKKEQLRYSAKTWAMQITWQNASERFHEIIQM